MKNLTIVLLLLAFSSCGVFRKVHKESTLDKVKTSSVVKSDSSAITVDKTTTTIKEKADTVVTTKKQVVTQETYFNMDSLVKGITAVQNELIDIRFTLNPSTGMLRTDATLKPQEVPFKFDKTTNINNDITKKDVVSKSSQDKKKESHEADLKIKEPKNLLVFYLVVVSVVALFLFGVYRFFRR
jgi:hypothetical protein